MPLAWWDEKSLVPVDEQTVKELIRSVEGIDIGSEHCPQVSAIPSSVSFAAWKPKSSCAANASIGCFTLAAGGCRRPLVRISSKAGTVLVGTAAPDPPAMPILPNGNARAIGQGQDDRFKCQTTSDRSVVYRDHIARRLAIVPPCQKHAPIEPLRHRSENFAKTVHPQSIASIDQHHARTLQRHCSASMKRRKTSSRLARGERQSNREQDGTRPSGAHNLDASTRIGGQRRPGLFTAWLTYKRRS
jgi:hypothetical protein